MPPRRRIIAIVLCAALAVLAGCSGDSDREPEPAPIAMAWREVALPLPPGTSGRAAPRAVAVCGGRWYVTGGVRSPDGVTRPTVWTSADGSAWTLMTLNPRSYYGKISSLYAAACRDGRLAAIGAQAGGAHGYPRTSTWFHRPDGVLDEVEARFELYGGPTATNVARLAAGPPGWMIAGNRATGAAVWHSADASEFAIEEAAPELATDDRGATWAADVAATTDGWLLVGAILRPGRIDRDPLAWTSADGRTWRRVAVPADAEAYDELQRVAVIDGGPVALGLRGPAFGVWRVEGDAWRSVGAFGATGGPAGTVRTVAAVEGRLLAVVSEGREFQLWSSADRGSTWRRVVAPAAAPAGAGRAVSVAGTDGRVLLLSDDGQSGRVWVADGLK
jgi:hypothetical protein